MGRLKLESTKNDEAKMEVIAACGTLVELSEALDGADAAALTQDFADDRPRQLAINALDGLIQKMFGELTQAQDAQVRLAILRLREQEKTDLANDELKQKAKQLASRIRVKACEVRDAVLNGVAA